MVKMKRFFHRSESDSTDISESSTESEQLEQNNQDVEQLSPAEQTDFKTWCRNHYDRTLVPKNTANGYRTKIYFAALFASIFCCIYLLFGTWHHQWMSTNYMNMATALLSSIILVFLTGIVNLAAAAWVFGNWYTKDILTRRFYIVYVVIRFVEIVTLVWLLVAIVVAYGSDPYSSFESEKISIGNRMSYFGLLAVITFEILYWLLHMHELRQGWRLCKWSAYKEFLSIGSEEGIEGEDVKEPNVSEPLSSARSVHSARSMRGPARSVTFNLSADQPAENSISRAISFSLDQAPSLSQVEIEIPYSQQVIDNQNNRNQTPFTPIFHEEFILQWSMMPANGRYQWRITHAPNDDKIFDHFHRRDFQVVHMEYFQHNPNSPWVKNISVFAMRDGFMFMLEITLDGQNQLLTATVKCPNQVVADDCLRVLELQRLFH